MKRYFFPFGIYITVNVDSACCFVFTITRCLEIKIQNHSFELWGCQSKLKLLGTWCRRKGKSSWYKYDSQWNVGCKGLFKNTLEDQHSIFQQIFFDVTTAYYVIRFSHREVLGGGYQLLHWEEYSLGGIFVLDSRASVVKSVQRLRRNCTLWRRQNEKVEQNNLILRKKAILIFQTA